MRNQTPSKRRKGAALVMFTLMLMTIILPMVGLAIDVTMLYIVRAKLSAAVDGGAIAAANSLSAGLTLAAQTAAAQKTASEFVNANFPAGFWGTYNLRLTPSSGADVQEDMSSAIKRRTVTIQADVDVPLLFMRALGWNKTTVQAYGQAGRRDVALMLVIDRSSSMGSPMAKQAAAAASQFVNGFSEGRDNLGLVVFGGSAIVAFPIGTNFKSASPNNIPSLLSLLDSQSNTGTTEALSLAYKQLQALNMPGALNVIVLFTDGLPNGITADFNVNGIGPLNANGLMAAGSTCTYKTGPINTSTHMLGWVAQTSGYAGNGTHGIYQLMSQDTSHTPDYYMGKTNLDSVPITNAGSANCTYKTTAPYVTTSDLYSLPTQDYYGNSTTGPDYTQSWIYKNKGGAAQNLKQPDDAYQIGLASWNATDNAGKTIRADNTLNPLIYCIGYFGSAGEPPDPVLMMRLANSNVAPTQFAGTVNTIYDSTKPRGQFVAASNAAGVNAAFATIQAEILRLMK
jgi:Flp pilus assembly protein TadG